MSDYTTHNEGLGGKGLLIALLVIVAFIIGLAMLGGNGTPTDPAAVPAANDAAPVADPAPVISE